MDILDLAIEKLYANADEYGVTSNICGIVKSIDDYQIKERNYDLVMAVSSLEHVDSKETFVNKLREIEHGIRKNGIVCLVVNSNIKEFDKKTGNEILPQFEVCLPTEEMQRIFEKAFSEWTVLKSTVVDQQYDIPRDKMVKALLQKKISIKKWQRRIIHMENKLINTGQNSIMDNFIETDDILKDMRQIIESSQRAAHQAVNMTLV